MVHARRWADHCHKQGLCWEFSLESILEVLGKYVDCCSVDPDNFVGEGVGLGYVPYVCTGEVLTALVCRDKDWSLW